MGQAVGAESGTYVPFPTYEVFAAGGFDISVVAGFEALLQDARERATPEALAAAVRIASRYAAVDSGALEGLYQTDRGFTRTIAEETATWEVALRAQGELAKRLIEDNLNAYEFVLDAVTGNVEISESWIRQLHETVCASQDTFTVYTPLGPQIQVLPKGQYKQMPNSPTRISTGKVHHYAPVTDTAAEMARFVDELRTPEFAAAHPVLQAAYAHYAFVCIHPFADGNGRVSRTLASVFLYRSPRVPLVIFADQRDQYLDALETADAGDCRPCVTFIEQRAIDAIELVRSRLASSSAPAIRDSLGRLTTAIEGRSGAARSEIDAIAKRVNESLLEEIQRAWRQVSATPELSLVVENGPRVGSQVPPGHRATAEGLVGLTLQLTTTQPRHSREERFVYVWPVISESVPWDYTISAGDDVAPLHIRLPEIRPVETQVFDLKVGSWVQGLLSVMLASTAQRVDDMLREEDDS